MLVMPKSVNEVRISSNTLSRRMRAKVSPSTSLISGPKLNRYLEILREEKAPEIAFLEKFSSLLLEFMIGSLMTHAVTKDDPDFEDFRRRVSTLVAENQANISRMPWIEPLIAHKNR